MPVDFAAAVTAFALVQASTTRTKAAVRAYSMSPITNALMRWLGRTGAIGFGWGGSVLSK